nr:hypothetical protein [Tanacetum cinerariifolium]
MIRAQVGDLCSHSTKYSSPALTQKVFANMRRVGKGFSRVDMPLFEGMIVAQQDDDIADEGAANVIVDDVPAAADEPTIPSPTPTTQPPPPSQDLPSTSQVQPTPPPSPISQPPSSQQQPQPPQSSHDAKILWIFSTLYWKHGRQAKSQAQIYQIDLEHADKVLSMHDDEVEPVELQEVVEVVTTAKLITKVVTAASATITAASATIIAVAITTAPSATRKRKGVRKEKEDNAVMMYQALKRKPQTKAQARKNMMIYLKNMVGFKMDYFKGMSYDDIRTIFEKKFNSNVAFLEKTREQMEEKDIKALKRTSKSQAEKVAKKQKLDEEVEELKRHLQIVPNNEDDVYTKATPLARKVPVVDYEIYTENNKPYYKIIRADGSPQLFLSFLNLLRNFDRKDLEICKATTARRIQTKVVFGYILQDQDNDQAG